MLLPFRKPSCFSRRFVIGLLQKVAEYIFALMDSIFVVFGISSFQIRPVSDICYRRMIGCAGHGSEVGKWITLAGVVEWHHQIAS